MISLKLTKKESKALEKEMSIGPSKDEYPWGTRIELEKDTLEKLGIKELPKIGTKMMIEAKVVVVATRQSTRRDGDSRTLELQITDMDMESDEDEVSEGELTRKESGAMGAVAKKMRDM